MRKFVIKFMASIAVLAISIIVFIFGSIPLIEGKHIINPYIDTNFSELYHPKKFDKIKIGMSKNEVTAIIGNPLSISGNTYYFTDDGKAFSKRKFSESGYFDYAWYRSSVTFDSLGKVIYIDKGWSYD